MKILNYRQLVIVGVILGLCTFWIVRLELNAAALASRVAELHNALDQNRDVLAGLEIFSRSVKSNDLVLDNNGIKLSAGNNKIQLNDKDGSISYDKVKMNWDQKKIEMWNDAMRVYLDSDKGRVYVGDHDASLRVGNIKGSTHNEQGIIMLSQPSSNKGGYLLISDKIMRMKSFDVPISIASPESPDYFGMKVDKKNELIELWNQLMKISMDEKLERLYVGNADASLRVGKIKGSSGTEEGIIILSQPNSNKGGYVLISDNVLRIKSTEVPVEITKGDCIIKIDDDKIEFTAKSDINITSENGNINLVGKRINLNE